jgi:hypothetical protein
MIRWSIILAAIFLFGLLPAHAAQPALAESAVIEDNIIYLRVASVAGDLAAEISSACTGLAATNKVIGTVLDLRFADGTDPAEARVTADYYSGRKLPLAVLVNDETRDAAANLATTLRNERAGLIFGNVTGGLKPDIAVTANTNNEKIFLQNPYATLATNDAVSPAVTNDLLPFVDHLSEADLVRQKVKDGEDDEDAEPAARPAPPKPVIRDPVLARAVDLLKGLAVVRLQHG